MHVKVWLYDKALDNLREEGELHLVGDRVVARPETPSLLRMLETTVRLPGPIELTAQATPRKWLENLHVKFQPNAYANVSEPIHD